MNLLGSRNLRVVCQTFAVVILSLATIGNAFAQLEITEYMNNPSGPGDNIWEWIEVRNTSGSPIDLKGYLGANLGDNVFDPNATFVDATVFDDFGNGHAINTVIPAGGVGVIYDGFDFTFPEENFDPNGFLQAWGLPSNAPVMPATFWPGLSNGGGNGQTIGFYAPDPNFNSTLDGIRVADRWPTYLLDSNGDPNDPEIASFANAAFSVDFNGFPGGSQGQSVTYSGNGSITDGANWAVSTAGDASGAITSSTVAAEGTASLNDPADLGNPGNVPAGPAASGLIVTEILYNPAGNEPQWEWVEVFNNTGSAIDFGADPNNGWVIDDSNGTPQAAPNITGTLGAGEVGILFNIDDISAANFLAAWDPNGAGLNLLEVTGWANMGLNNGNDHVGLWSTFNTYFDPNAGAPNFDLAAAEQDYGTTGFPIEGQGQSIHLGDLTDPNTPGNWVGAVLSDFGGSYNATEVFDPNGSNYHEGGDQGSPGSFTPFVIANDDADFDGDGVVTGLDFLIYQQNFGATGQTDNSNGDANGDGVVDAADLAIYEGQYGTSPVTANVAAVPEPSTVLLTMIALAPLGLQRRRKS